MSALGDYYRAQSEEKIANLPLLDQQRQNLQSQQQQTQANTGEIAANAAAQRATQYANAGLANTTAGIDRAKLPGQIAQTDANTAATTTQTSLAGPTAAADIFSRMAQGGLANTTALTDRAKLPGQLDALSNQNAGLDVETQAKRLQNSAFGSPSSGVLGFAAGGVVGKTKPMKPKAEDTQPAMLAPGEAVLNRGAAEHMGKGVIDHLNKHGMLRMAAQKEVSAHVAKLAQHAGPKGKPKPGTVMHFLTGGMVPSQPAGAGAAQGSDLLSMLATMAGPGAGAGGGAAPGAAMGSPMAGAPSAAAPAPRARHKGKR